MTFTGYRIFVKFKEYEAQKFKKELSFNIPVHTWFSLKNFALFVHWCVFLSKLRTKQSILHTGRTKKTLPFQIQIQITYNVL